MPVYDFRNKETGEVFEKAMKIADKQQYLADNTNIEQVHSTMNLGDPVRLGVRKADGGFKEVLQKIHSRAPGSKLNTIADI